MNLYQKHARYTRNRNSNSTPGAHASISTVHRRKRCVFVYSFIARKSAVNSRFSSLQSLKLYRRFQSNPVTFQLLSLQAQSMSLDVDSSGLITSFQNIWKVQGKRSLAVGLSCSLIACSLPLSASAICSFALPLECCLDRYAL